jgi:hypothetical protein
MSSQARCQRNAGWFILAIAFCLFPLMLDDPAGESELNAILCACHMIIE